MSNFKSSLINDLAVARLGKPGGFAELGSDGKVKLEQLPTTNRTKLVNRQTIIADIALLNTDFKFQHIITTTAGLLVNLPTSPVNGLSFTVKNSTTSTESFTTNSVIIAPGESYEIVYDGVVWVEL